MNQKFDYPNKRLSIRREMPIDAICLLMSEGNRSVFNLLKVVAQVDPNLVLVLDDMNMRGAQIFAGCIGYCESWMPRFLSCIRARDPDMIAYVNQKVPQFKAVTKDGRIRS